MNTSHKALKSFVLIASLSLLLGGCSMTQKGAATGAVIGAGAGAIIGHNSSAGAGAGALVGAAVGGLGGALAGDAYEDHTQQEDSYEIEETYPYQ